MYFTCQETHQIEVLDLLPGPEEIIVQAEVDGFGMELTLGTAVWAEFLQLEPEELRRVLWASDCPTEVTYSLDGILVAHFHRLTQGINQ